MSEKIVVAIPCLNEEATISQVVQDFQKELPAAKIHVFDNNSKDRSAILAKESGAVVHVVRQRGKGNVLRIIFDTVDADTLIVVDGDGTYLASEADNLLEPIRKSEADMVVGNRLKHADQDALMATRRIGNYIIGKTVNMIFGTQFEDVLSGYRAFNRRFIEAIPLLTQGFETEAELTIQALEARMDVVETPISYKSRPENSQSKLRPFADGGRIMLTIAMLLRDHYPFRTYCSMGLLCFGIFWIALILKITNHYGLTALSDSVLAAIIIVFILMGAVLFCMGFVLSAINTRFRELKQIIMRNYRSKSE